MRCYCCNRSLSDYESRLRHPVTNDFLDICKKCLRDIPITPVEPADVADDIGFDEEEFFPEVEEDDESC